MRRPCPTCGGKGVVVITGVYADTLALLRHAADEVTAATLARADGCKATAMSNRLAALEKMGLAQSRRYGRERLYRAREAI